VHLATRSRKLTNLAKVRRWLVRRVF